MTKLSPGEAIELAAASAVAASEVFGVIGDATDGMPGHLQAATRCLIMELIVQHTCSNVGEQTGVHPRALLEKLIDQVARNLPERPVEEVPTRAPKTKGPSPWGQVR